MVNLLVLNEIDPLPPIKLMGGKLQFAPSDLILLTRQAWPDVSRLALVDMFLQSLERLHQEWAAHGWHLLLRDHSYSHFLTGPAIPERPSLREIVDGRLQTL